MNINRRVIKLLFVFLIPSTGYAMDSKLAYLAHTEGYWQVWSMNSDGDSKKQITTSQFDKSHISWYPDGKHILVNANQGGIWKVGIESNEEVEIILPIKGTVDAVISPDGKEIAFSLSVAGSVDNNHLWLTNEKGQNLTKLTNMKGLQHEPVWSPDGKWVYFLSGQGQQNHDIWRVSLQTKATEKLTTNQLYHFDLAFSPEGKMMFSNNRTGNYDIWIRDNEGVDEALTKHKARDSRPAFSKDGDSLFFESSRSGAMNIWRKSLNGVATQLTNEKIGARFPIVSY